MNTERCKEYVTNSNGFGFHHCSRKPWKDGYCKQHHPDTVAARREASEKRWNEKQEKSPYRVIERLQGENDRLRAELETLRKDKTRLKEALSDMLSGWVYIRKVYGDLSGVGWDRAQNKAQSAMQQEPTP